MRADDNCREYEWQVSGSGLFSWVYDFSGVFVNIEEKNSFCPEP